MINRLFAVLSSLFGKPIFWCGVVGTLAFSLGLNIGSHNHFDPGMNYSNFLQNWLQVLALAVSCVSVVRLSASHDDLHEKVDALRGEPPKPSGL